ncbi:hypothetical protein [Clostridium sp. AWRP]|uniref:hypothetical protein n=1 Tax=Clostridium sp. AWRP TaxID=2212991 RepID=UPI000FD9E42E|nr:hypothetical protein [Clostridium sp. AWRP]AZV56034.1 hypothetical protein DMR38_05145 [Clostridium sp. AWRP]
MNLKMPIVFDNDCISSFSWIHRIDLINNLFKHQIIIPEPVYGELEKMRTSKFSYVFSDIKKEIDNQNFEYKEIKITDSIFTEYLQLTTSLQNREWIGKGEASAIVIAKDLGGTLASNNLRDVLPHIKNGQPPLICTEEILFYCYKMGFIKSEDGEEIWNEMKSKKRKLPKYDFNEVIRRHEK